MRFEARELPPYAEPLTADQLNVGDVYFVVTFADNEGLVPEMKAVVLAGTDLEGEGEGRLYFQDFASYQRGERHSSPTGKVQMEFETCLPDDLGFVFSFERAVDVLLACSLKRRSAATDG